jgi:phosphoenolpyruvate carboxykinase (ATP)
MNIEINTHPTGRSPENKFFFGDKAKHLDLTRPKYNKIGVQADWDDFYATMSARQDYKHDLEFTSVGIRFRVLTNDDRHAQFVRNMFTVDVKGEPADFTILHNTNLEIDQPKIYVHLDKGEMLIAGTTFLGEIKKGAFGIISFMLPDQDILPMHCSAFTYQDTTNLMFGLSGTGKTTLSSDPDYWLVGDDEIAWGDTGIQMIETGCYAKSEGLTPETHKTIFDAVELARSRNTLVVENPGVPNARLSYPIDCVENAYHTAEDFDHPDNIFFLTMDANGVFPPVSKISGDTVRRFFETGYTSQMPGTEAGTNEIKPLFSPCYGSPFMPRAVSVYSDMLMKKIDKHASNVYLINTGMDANGDRYSLEFTRQCVKDAITNDIDDTSKQVLDILEGLVNENTNNAQ